MSESKDPLAVISSAWRKAVHTCDWSFDSQIVVLLGFIDASAVQHPALAEEFQAYLRDIVDDELRYEAKVL